MSLAGTPADGVKTMRSAIRSTLLRLIGAVAVGALTATASAHHSFAMFDMEKDVEFKGVVTEYVWANPHVHVMVRIEPGPGVDPALVGLWDFECNGSITIMSRQGWTRATLKAGDPIHGVMRPLRDGNKGGALFYMIKADGTRMYTDIARPKAGA